MDLCMSALIFCSSFHTYNPLIITILNRAKKQSYSVVNSRCDVGSGRHSHAPCTFLMEGKIALNKSH